MSTENNYEYDSDREFLHEAILDPKKKPLKDRIKNNFSHPGTKRILWVSAIAIVVIMGTVAFNLSNVMPSGEVELVGDIDKFDTVSRGKNQLENKEMQRQAKAADEIRIDEAIDRNGSAAIGLPLDAFNVDQEPNSSSESDGTIIATTVNESGPILRTVKTSTEESGSNSDSESSGNVNQVLVDKIAGQFAANQNKWDQFGETVTLVGSYQPDRVATSDLQDPSTTEGADTDEPVRVVARAGEMFYGINRVAATSDLPGTPIIFDVNTGILTDHTFIGSFASNSTCMQVTMNSVSGPRFSQPISAVMIDPSSMDSCVYDLVRPRLIERYGMKLAVAILGGFASAKASAASTVVTSALGSVTEVQEAQTEDQAVWAGVESLADTAQDELDTVVDENFGRPEVALYSNASYAIVLLSDLTEPIN
ncbi:hypothetical protein SAMN02744133_108105 [Thalassospira xiamenensis M-5 = DSM 17429]|uniref:Uncharacterized protein n=1 Tax=Thalassospira xiamenensis M-5 = DSM 17429 TaxID=1123366 RepID=A0AB72UJY5_9PROT|nr:hypothetical protein [Thalassospira xiamenensis]AJD54380.1 hypothetical protein TH3_21538 [Thalassospira xiamenensis M-5 = DSM 17429]SIT21727.1 hypothetical protein SAMN02744133_108105 [Thalassospira xiamenensis M-5 = DSM 17429]